MASFVCPITRETFIDPVVAADGHTYERSAINTWLYGSSCRHVHSKCSRRLSPLTGLPLASLELRPNFTLRKVMDELHHAEPASKGKASGTRVSVAASAFLSVGLALSYLCWRVFAGRLFSAMSALSTPGPLLLLIGSILCAAGLSIDDEKVALALVLAGAPLACVSFLVGVVCASCGDAASALFLARCLMLAGLFFCGVGGTLSMHHRRHAHRGASSPSTTPEKALACAAAAPARAWQLLSGPSRASYAEA